MEELAVANLKKNEAIEQRNRLKEQCSVLEQERDEATRRVALAECSREPVVDTWTTHTVEVALPFPKPPLGIILSGGRSKDANTPQSPIYVQDVLIPSPLENILRRLDHILLVNDIDITDMDKESVINILKNSHHLKMLIRRRANAHKIHEIALANGQDIGAELTNGVFVNSVEVGSLAARAEIEPGCRIVHVNNVPVFDAKHADQLIKFSNGQVVVGILDGKKRDCQMKDANKQKATLFSKLFGRTSTEKARTVVAKASIDNSDNAFCRQGSLRIPAPSPIISSDLVRYGSLRAPHGSVEHAKIAEHMDAYLKKNHASRTSAASEAAGSTWPKVVPEEDGVVLRPPRRMPQRPSVQAFFGVPNSPASSVHSSQRPSSRVLRQPSEASSSRHGCHSPTSEAWSPRPSSRVLHSVEHRAVTSPIHGHRMTMYSPALPQPPPYPGPREDSMSSFLSSSNSLPHPSTSSINLGYHSYLNNSPSGTLLSETSDQVRRVCLSKEGNEFGLGVENANGGVVISTVAGRTNGVIKRGDRLLDVGGINMRMTDKDAAAKVIGHLVASQDEVTLLVSSNGNPRYVQVPRKSVKLCGGNAMGILAEASAGELQEGDLILEIDGLNVRGATLEGATEALLDSLSETAELLIDEGGDRLNRLRLGADGDSFYVRINVDRNSDNKDELDIKAGEIVFVDKTLFMGQRGRWRAWKVDREGRQRENGVIPSHAHMESELRKSKKNSKNRLSICRPIYERVERVSSARRRPVVIYGALVAPFIQTLLDDSTKFAQCMFECKAMQAAEVDRLLASHELIDARKRDKLYDVIEAAAIQNVIDNGVHCILDVAPQAIHRLHAIRLYPIVLRLKFKSPKQVKDIKEEFTQQKFSSKQAKELMDKCAQMDVTLQQLNCAVNVVLVSSQAPVKTLIKNVCQQISANIDHEQKKTIWVTSQLPV